MDLINNQTDENNYGDMSKLLNIPRYVPDNPSDYTPLQQAERKNILKLLEKDYPKLPCAWLEMVYDYCKTTPTDELEKIINERRFEVPGKHTPRATERNPN